MNPQTQKDEIKGKLSDFEENFQKLNHSIYLIAEKNPNWAIEMGLRWLKKNQNDDGGFGLEKGKPSVIHLTALAFLALSKSKIYDMKHPTIKKIITYLKSTQDKKGWWAYEEKSITGSVGVTGTILQALNNIQINQSKDMYRNASEFIKNSYSYSKNCWRDNEFAEYGEVSVNESAFNAIPYLLDKEHEKRMTEVLTRQLNADGGYGKNFYNDNQMDESDIENTALALKIMKNLNMDLTKSPVKEAINYIFNSQEPNGGFPRKKQIVKRNIDSENDATALAISGLIDIGIKAHDPVIHSATAYILKNINIDGGWGDVAGMDSDTDTTAISVIALMDAWKTVVPLSEIKRKIADTKCYVNNFIEKHVEHLDNELYRGQSLSRILEISITLLGVLIPIVISILIGD